MKQFLLALLLSVPALATITITPTVLPHCIPAVACSITMTATGGTGPYTWALVSGTWPTGFSISSGGVLSGTAALTAQTSVVVRATDSLSATNTATVYISVQPNRVGFSANPTVSTAMYAYTSESWPQAADFLRQHIDVFNGGGGTVGTNSTDTNPWNVGYVDGAGWYPGQLNPYVFDVCTSRSWSNCEDMMLHNNIDYYAPAGGGGATGWLYMDCFGCEDQVITDFSGGMGLLSTSNAHNGVLRYNGSYTDFSTTIFTSASVTLANTNYLYIGYFGPFDLINITLGTARVGGTALWEYWNGSAWTTLSLDQADTTSGLTISGAHYVQFTPPAAWAMTTVNGSRSKFFVRVSVTGTSTAPIFTQIKGDDWVSHSVAVACVNPCTHRGWDGSAGGVVTVAGTYGYNPSPAANATARFRYQGRLSGYWQHDYIFGNMYASNGGVLMLPASKVPTTQAVVAAYAAEGIYYTGVFFDNIGDEPAYPVPAFTDTTMDIGAGHTFAGGWPAYFISLTPAIHTALGAAFKVTPNVSCTGSCTNAVAAAVDGSLEELTANIFQLGGPGVGSDPGYYYAAHYDSFAAGPAKRFFSLWDNRHFQISYDPCAFLGHTSCPTYEYWDGGDQGPMQGLAGHLLALNNYSVLNYNTYGYIYDANDEVYVINDTTTTLASPVVRDVDGTPQTIITTDDSSFESIATGSNGYAGYFLQIGSDWINATKTSSNHYAMNTGRGDVFLTSAYSAGTTVHSAVVKHLASDPVPAYGTVFWWAFYFPAMSYNFGSPVEARNVWKTGISISGAATCGTNPVTQWQFGCPQVEKREFTNAVVLQRAMGGSQASEWTTPSSSMSLASLQSSCAPTCSYNRLHADATTTGPITTLTLTGNETAILVPVTGLFGPHLSGVAMKGAKVR